MKYFFTFFFLIVASSMLSSYKKLNTTSIINSDGNKLKLFWSDEFEVSGSPDSSKWSYEIGNGPDGWGNQELEYYTNESNNAFVKNGMLNIQAIKENYEGRHYTSARLISKGKFEFTYGVVKIRAKMPIGVGTWPAVWMMGADINTVGWPACGEIDITEHLGRDLNTIYGTVHYPGRSGGNPVGATTMISNATTEFHEYKLEWSNESLKFYVDDTLFHTVANSIDIPFNKNFFFLVNLAIGGGFGGAVDPDLTSATMEVDYIRVYK